MENKIKTKNSERIFLIIELITNQNGIKFVDIQKALCLPKSSLFVLLNELVEIGILDYDNVSKNYSIGFNFIQLSYKCISNIDFYKIIDTACLKLSNILNETVHAAILTSTDITYISKHEGKDKVSIINNIGMTLPAHVTSIGKALLSGYTDDEIRVIYKNKVLNKFTPNSISSLDELIDEVNKIREKGYATEYGEVSLLAACVSVPIRQNNRVVAAISATVPISKLNDDYRNLIFKLLDESRQKIEQVGNQK